MSSLTVKEALTKATESLRFHGLPSARLDAEVILGFVLRTSRPDLYVKSTDYITDEKLKEYLELVARRIHKEPVAYITGEKEFMSLSFRVSRNVLIPRPETEILVEEALEIKPLRIIDVGTGSGAIAVSLAYYLPDSQVWAIDISPEAVTTARYNAGRHGVNTKITFFQGNLLDPLDSPEFNSRFDLIAANLPYIPSQEMDNLPLDVSEYEPLAALDGGSDGLRYHREMLPRALELLKFGGVLLLELGYQQAVELRAALISSGYSNIKIVKDLAGFDRVIKAYKF